MCDLGNCVKANEGEPAGLVQHDHVPPTLQLEESTQIVKIVFFKNLFVAFFKKKWPDFRLD